MFIDYATESIDISNKQAQREKSTTIKHTYWPVRFFRGEVRWASSKNKWIPWSKRIIDSTDGGDNNDDDNGRNNDDNVGYSEMFLFIIHFCCLPKDRMKDGKEKHDQDMLG